jgi:hypothetical protein
MKYVYIPKGESRNYERLFTDNLVVNGYLNVENELKAKHISGSGVITAGRVSADDITAAEIETSSIICKRLMAKRVSAAEVYASDCTAVSCFLEASYVETGRLTTAFSEVSEVKADEVIHLPAKKRGMVLTLFLSVLRTLWVTLTAPPEPVEDMGYSPQHTAVTNAGRNEAVHEDGVYEEVARTVRELLEKQYRKLREQESAEDAEDFELKRLVSIFKLLREQGYTLRIEPGTPEENAPVFDFENDELRPAA